MPCECPEFTSVISALLCDYPEKRLVYINEILEQPLNFHKRYYDGRILCLNRYRYKPAFVRYAYYAVSAEVRASKHGKPSLDPTQPNIDAKYLSLAVDEVVRLFVDYGYDLNLTVRPNGGHGPELPLTDLLAVGKHCQRGETVLHPICKIGWLEAFKTLLRHGASLKHQDVLGRTPLQVLPNNPIVQTRFKEALAQHYREQCTRLHQVLSSANLIQVKKMLLEQETDLLTTDNGLSALMVVSEYDSPAHQQCLMFVLSFLLAHFSQQTIKDYINLLHPKTGKTVLHNIAFLGMHNVYQTLIHDCQANAQQLDHQQRTAEFYLNLSQPAPTATQQPPAQGVWSTLRDYLYNSCFDSPNTSPPLPPGKKKR